MAAPNDSVSIFQRLREQIELEFNAILVLLSDKKSRLLTFLDTHEFDFNNSNRQINEDIDRLNKLRHVTEELLITNNLGNTQEILVHEIDSKLNEFKINKRKDPIFSLECDVKGLSDLIEKFEIKIGIFHPQNQELVLVSSQDLLSIHPTAGASQPVPSQSLDHLPFSTQSDLDSDC